MDAPAGLWQDVPDALPPASTALPAAASQCLRPPGVRVGCCGRPHGGDSSASRLQIPAVLRCALSMGFDLQTAPSPRRRTGC